MPVAAAHSANTDGGSIIANNIISDSGHGDASWIWGDDRSPFRFEHRLPWSGVGRTMLELGTSARARRTRGKHRIESIPCLTRAIFSDTSPG